MEAHMVIGALSEHAKTSLEYLSLTGPCDVHDGQSQIHHCNGSLQDFEVLNDVVILYDSGAQIIHLGYVADLDRAMVRVVSLSLQSLCLSSFKPNKRKGA